MKLIRWMTKKLYQFADCLYQKTHPQPSGVLFIEGVHSEQEIRKIIDQLQSAWKDMQ